ncbi:beta-1 3-glucan synthesis protein [Sporocytophaga myxococcoides]|uniref:Beta-1 3-glucan synthesis protein n=1 Tax=Sporocytophaga myxococcoides TaxID=153721 RepID=A0A098LA86_9BACT|nr:SMI1/KNR4 family protein [Sporocytophaga myxococcoides]GAL83319.1 beta-1 3-glucan synthesis protein [Sporocytophaga myxococcoides]
MKKEKLLNKYHEEVGKEDFLIDAAPYFQGYLAFILPDEEEDVFFSSITTIGLSNLFNEKKYIPTEIILEIDETFSEETVEGFSKQLLEFYNKELSKKDGFKLNTIIPHSIDLIRSTPYFFVSQYLGLSTEWGFESDPTVQMLQLIPLTEGEAKELENIEDKTKSIIINETYKILRNPYRTSLPLVATTIKNLWSKISKWYSKNSETLKSRLMSGASEKEMEEFRNSYPVEIPKDYYYSLLQHNGKMSFYNGYEYLKANLAVDLWKEMKSNKEQGAFNKLPEYSGNKIKQTWWNQSWIPFAVDSGGNLFCIDLDPAEGGSRGQVILWERAEGPLESGAASFTEWLYLYLRGLYNGIYKLDDEGFLET